MASFSIVGAGAVGGIVGAALTRAGHAVRFIEADAAHRAAIEASGLKVSGAMEAVIRPPVEAPSPTGDTFGAVLLAVKSGATLAALDTIAPRLAPDGFVVSLQNGLEERRIAARIGQARTIGAFLTFGGHVRAPGEVVYGGPGTFRIGELDGRSTPRIEALRDALAALQPVEITANIFGYLWGKLALVAIYFATALGDADVPDLYAIERNRGAFAALAAEVVAVAHAEGVRIEPFDGFNAAAFAGTDEAAIEANWAGQLRYWTRHPGRRTGIWRDLAQHHRRTELDGLVLPVIEMGAERGVATPRLSRLASLIRDVEEGRRALGPDTLRELVEE